MSDIKYTDKEIAKERSRSYSKGYQAGKRSASTLDTSKQETYNVIVSSLAKMYLDGGWGTKVDGKHVKWRPDECYENAIKYANKMIREVSIK